MHSSGISYGAGLEAHMVNILKEMAAHYSIHCFLLDASSSSIDEAIRGVMLGLILKPVFCI
ncbi:unnamed protein product [Malus baccata var. baccata]